MANKRVKTEHETKYMMSFKVTCDDVLQHSHFHSSTERLMEPLQTQESDQPPAASTNKGNLFPRRQILMVIINSRDSQPVDGGTSCLSEIARSRHDLHSLPSFDIITYNHCHRVS